MSERVAPSALRRPISPTRSVTDTSMMFMTPIPPTRRETPATPARSSVSVALVESRVLRTCSWVVVRKSACVGSVIPWVFSRRLFTSWRAVSMVSRLVALTRMRCTEVSMLFSPAVWDPRVTGPAAPSRTGTLEVG